MTSVRLVTGMLTGLMAILPWQAARGDFPQDGVEGKLAAIRDEYQLPGLAAAVIRDGVMAGAWAVGVRKAGGSNAVTVNDRWHIGSCGKSMTAALAAMLVDEGVFRWEMTLPELLPSLASTMQEPWREVTLEQLLSHQSGAPGELDADGLWERLWERAKLPPREQREYLARELLTKSKPVSQPGTQYEYSNAGYALAGHAIETVCGKPWEEVLLERLATPLGLKSVGFGSPAATSDQPWGHELNWLGMKRPVKPDWKSDNPAAIAPSGGIHCSITDLAAYAAWQMRGAQGKGELLKPETFLKLHTAVGKGDYALGWMVLRRSWGGGKVLMHNGSNTTFYTVIWIAPQKDFAVVVCTNFGDGFDAADKVSVALTQEFLRDRKTSGQD